MFKPTIEEFKELAKKGNLIPVTMELVADEETPVSAFHKLCQKEDFAYLLESVEGGEHLGRYSFLSFQPKAVMSGQAKDGDPLAKLKEYMASFQPVVLPGLPRFWGGAVGYLSYDAVRAFEHLPDRLPDDLKIPDYCFLITDTLMVFDRLRNTMILVACVDLRKQKNPAQAYRQAVKRLLKIVSALHRSPRKKKALRKRQSAPVAVASNLKKEDFLKAVGKAKDYISAGDIIQVVLSQRFNTKVSASPFEVYRALRLVNPSPYMYYIHFKQFSLVGSSPEILVRKEGALAETRPIAGTRPRGASQEEDLRLERELRVDPKEQAEHLMLVDLGRNDLGRVCEFGSVQTQDFMSIERYSHVMHLVTTVTGKLSSSENSFDLLRACFPAGTVAGAPKIRAMEIIEELETVRRGPYAGAIGYISFDGNMDMAITIRTVLMKDHKAYVQAGAGIVADSNPEKEYEESRSKAAALFAAIERAERGL